jgi:hypothetical protein
MLIMASEDQRKRLTATRSKSALAQRGRREVPMTLDRFQSDEVLDDDDDTTEPSKWERGTGLWQRALREGREQGREQGRGEGLRRALVLVMTSRGRELDAAELRALDSADHTQLEAWLRDGFTPLPPN